MNKLLEAYMELSKMALGKEASEACFSEVDWEELFQISRRRMTAVLCSNAVAQLAQKSLAPEDVSARWAEYSSAHFVSDYMRWNSIKELLTKAEKKGIELIMFKGYVIAQLYPSFGMRNSSDTDFLIRRNQLEDAKALMEEEYEFVQECSKEQVYTYRHKTLKFGIELHLQLWEDYEGRRINTLKDLELDAKESLIICDIYGQKILTLNVTNHLIYQIFHVVKHFSVEGLGTRYLIDITLFCEHYYNEICWSEFWQAMDALHYTGFCRQFFSLGIRYFGLRLDILGNQYIEKIADEQEFLTDMMYGGIMCEGQKGSYQILGIMTPYLTGECAPAASKFGRTIQTLFPSAKNIREDFGYAKKHKILLPIAWVHRFVDYFLYRKKHPDESYTVDDKLLTAEYRINQLKKRGLVD